MKDCQIFVHSVENENYVLDIFIKIGHLKIDFNPNLGFPRWVVVKNGIITGKYFSQLGIDVITLEQLKSMRNNID